MRRLWLGLIGASCWAQGTPCVLRGTVVDQASGKGLAKAHVFVTKAEETLLRTTGDRGEFCFDAVAAGRYQVMAKKVGYLDTWYKARPGQNQGAAVSVRKGEDVAALKIEMVARAILAGMVVDADGEPVVDADVAVYRPRRTKDGEPTDSSADGQTDDHGRFRFADLPPGSYTVGVSHQRAPGGEFRDEKGRLVDEEIPETLYPGTVTLVAGHDIDNLTVTLGKPVGGPRRHLSGKVAPPVKDSRLRAEVVESPGCGSGFHLEVAADGSFSRGGVAPCRYVVELWAPQKHGRLEVDLTASDAEGLTIVPQPWETVDVPLTIRTEGGGPPFRLTLWTRATLSGEQTYAYANEHADGSYLFREVQPGVRKLHVQTGIEPYFVKDIRYGGHAVSADQIEVRGGMGAIEVTMSPNVASIEGRVTGAAERPVTILLVDGNGYRDTVADQQGNFKLEAVRPGKFRMFAIEDFDGDDWRSELAASLKGVVVEVAEKEHKQTEVPLIPADEWLAAVRK